MSMSLVPTPAPKACSPMAAAVASLSTTTGTPKRRSRRSRSGTSVSGRLTDSTTRPPAKSTMEATPTPMPSTAGAVLRGPRGRRRCRAGRPRPSSTSVSVVNRSSDLRRLHLGARARSGRGGPPAHERGGHLGAADVDADDDALGSHDVPSLPWCRLADWRKRPLTGVVWRRAPGCPAPRAPRASTSRASAGRRRHHMARQDEDREGAQALQDVQGRPRQAQPARRRTGRRAAGAHAPARRRRRATAGPAYPRQSDKAYHTYGPGAGRRTRGRHEAGSKRRRRRSPPPAPLPLVVHPRRRLRRCSSSPASSSPSSPGPGTRSSTGPSTRPTSASTGRPAPSSPRTTAGSGATAPRCCCSASTRPASRRTRTPSCSCTSTRSRTPINQLSIPRDTLVNVEGYGQQKINAGHVVRRAVAGAQDRQGVHRHPHQPRHGRELPGLPPARQRRRRRRHVRAADGQHRGGLEPAARRHLQEGHAPLRRQERDAVRAHPQGVRRGRLHARHAPAGVRRRRSRRRSSSRPTSPSCPRSAGTS